MGGKDDDPRNDLDKWVEAQRAEILKLRDELLGQRDDLQSDLSSWSNNASSSLRGPFERFKSFVDTNFSTLSEGFRNFPSNISELKSRMQEEREARRAEEREIWQRWTGSEDSPDHIRMQIDRSSAEDREAAKEATYMLLRESYERNKHVPVEKIINLYRDHEWNFGGLDQFANPMLSFGGACYYKPETVENLPSTARWGWPAPRLQWLSIDWFKRSPYSPIRLEAHSDTGTAGTKWRAAFEDLLSATLDKPMISEEKVGQRMPHGKPQSTYHGPGLDWMLSLQCRGILPPQLPSLYKPVSLFDGFDEVKRPRTAEFTHNMDQVILSKSTSMYPLVKRDLNLLMDEVAIQSGPETEATPIPVAVAPWRVPSTEQELYDDMPPLNDPMAPWVPVMTGDKEEDLIEAEDALYDALDCGDADIAAKCLEAYYYAHGSVSKLLRNVHELKGTEVWSMENPWHCVVRDALERSSLPWANSSKQAARVTLKDHQQTEERERFTSEHWSKIAGREIQRDDLTDKASEREEDRRPDLEADQTATPKRPDILSQLTTTQTTRLPDGTVTQKVILKQHFTDGREEVTETVHTSHERAPVPDEHALQETKRRAGEKPKSGWFWS